MAMARRRWGKQSQAEMELARPTVADSAPVPALGTIEELTVRARWSQLAADARADLLSPYAEVPGPAPRRPSALTEGDASADEHITQDGITTLLRAGLQRSAIAVIDTWLASAAPDAHLAVYGSTGRGRTSAVTALARRAVRDQPAAPDYCYVPDPEALSHWTLLAVPTGTGTQFCESLNAAVHQIAQRWDKARAKAGGDGEEDDSDRSALSDLVRDQLASLLATATEPMHAYLERLTRAILDAGSESACPVNVDADCPAGRMERTRQGALDGESGMTVPSAPVVVAALARTELTRVLLRANGGVLIIPAIDLVDRDQPTNEWGILRSVLRTGSLPMRPVGEPQIPIDVRVALVGSTSTLRVLERSEDFGRLFRYRALFEDSAPWTDESEAAYATLCDGVGRMYSLPPFDHAAVGSLVEEGARRISVYNRTRVTTDLALLRDLALEAGRLAQERVASADSAETLAGVTTSAADVEAVIARRRETYGRPARESRDDILTGRTIVPTAGSAIGQVNGLTVITVYPPGQDSRFGVPFRVTVTVTPGRERLVDVEREADHADRSHVAGALTMAGYLAWRYGHDRPIHAVARLRFEQGGTTAGPSASAAELFALISALARVPVRSCVAVTGAVGQHGEVQVIGSVAEKIEGFWHICRARRERGEIPHGDYGILIPAANKGDLLLRADVAQRIVDEGWFHIWPIAEVDQGIPMLTGMPAPAVHARVDSTLARYYELARTDQVVPQ